VRSQLIDELGRAYATGSMTIASVAERLGATVADAIVTLEEAGYARPLHAIPLSASDRAEILARLRRDRLRRDGVPDSSSRFRATRHAIASLRLSGVDARGILSSPEGE
jgi:hypothetical protein